MRQIFSFRFIAALAAIAGLLAVLVAAQNEQSSSANPAIAEPTDGEVVRRRIDFVDNVFGVENVAFAIGDDGTATVDSRVVIDGERALTIVAGTPGEIDCPNYLVVGQCAIAADLLGESVVWFALVPSVPGQAIELPAIDVLEEDLAVLVNGWELPYAPILDRRCPDREWDSYRAFRADLGDHFTSLYDVAEQRLVAVVCDITVPWVTTTTAAPTTTIPVPTGPTPTTPPIAPAATTAPFVPASTVPAG